MFGGVSRVRERQLAAAAGLLEEAFHLVDHLLRPGLEEQLGKLGVLPGLRGHQAGQGDRLVAVDQPVEAAGDIQQDLFQRRAFGQLEVQGGKLLGALGLHRFAEQGFLVGEVAVDGELGNAGFRGDGFHAAAVVAVAEEQALGRLENGFPFGRVLGPAGTDGGGGF